MFHTTKNVFEVSAGKNTNHFNVESLVIMQRINHSASLNLLEMGFHLLGAGMDRNKFTLSLFLLCFQALVGLVQRAAEVSEEDGCIKGNNHMWVALCEGGRAAQVTLIYF